MLAQPFPICTRAVPAVIIGFGYWYVRTLNRVGKNHGGLNLFGLCSTAATSRVKRRRRGLSVNGGSSFFGALECPTLRWFCRQQCRPPSLLQMFSALRLGLGVSAVVPRLSPPVIRPIVRCITVAVPGDGVEQAEKALKTLQRAMSAEGILRQLKRKTFYEKPCDKRVRESERKVRFIARNRVNKLKEWIDYERER